MRIEFSVRVRVIPRDRLVYSEAVRLGEIEPRDASEALVMDATIFLDDAELKRISAIPEVAHAMKNVVEPTKPTYKPNDWRAQRYSASREAQWQQKPIIDYIVANYKKDIMQAIQDQFKIPADWKALLFDKATYRAEPKTLQLAPTEDKKWNSVFVQTSSDLGSSDDASGFLGRFAAEFQAAKQNGLVTQQGNSYTFPTTLTGFDSSLKALDPYSGAKLSDTKIHGWDVADEPGYDKEIRNAFMDHFSYIVGNDFVDARVREIKDDGQVVFTSSGPYDQMPEETPEAAPEI